MLRIDRASLEATEASAKETALRAALQAVRVDGDLGAGRRLAVDVVRSNRISAASWVVETEPHRKLSLAADLDRTVFTIGQRLEGRYAIRSSQGRIDGSRPHLYPEEVQITVGHTKAVTLAIARSVVHRRARTTSGHDGFNVRFTGNAPLSPAHDALWAATIEQAAHTLRLLDADYESSLLHANLTSLLAGTLLKTFPNTLLRSDCDRGSTRAAPAALRRAIAYADDHLGDPITVDDLVVASGMSIRTLQVNFRRYRGTTPDAYLRNARLVAAHEALLSATPHDTTVAAIARKWGFHHLGRFSALHRRTFDENPSAALAR